MLTQLLPEIQKGAAAVTKAELPGILREKKGLWESGVKNLNQTLVEYEAAVKSGNGDRLLSAAEQLHMRYEGLVRAIRPVLKELDDFHVVLYMLYHYYTPQSDLPKVRDAAAKLTERMATLEKATLPQRLAAKAESFNKARKQLAEAVIALDHTVKTDSEEKLKESLKSAVDGVHGKYVALEKIFE
jgi:DNA mismatch repair ATPase MutS